MPTATRKLRRNVRSISTSVRSRAAKLLETEFEFIFSREFDCTERFAAILAEMPKTDDPPMPVIPPPDTPAFLADSYRFPLLTPVQEHHLFRKRNFLHYRAEQLRRRLDLNRPDVKRMNEIDRLRRDARDLRNQIVNANLRLVVSIAKTLVDSANPLDELISDGNLPLIRAAEIFDFTRGFRFSTYATWAIRNGLFRSSKRNRRLRSRQCNGTEGLMEVVSDERCSVQSAETRRREFRDVVKRGLKELELRDRKIVTSRFGLGTDDQPMKFREIAEELNLSTERIRQLLARSLMRLQETVDPGIIESSKQAI